MFSKHSSETGLEPHTLYQISLLENHKSVPRSNCLNLLSLDTIFVPTIFSSAADTLQRCIFQIYIRSK